ncbi:MAG: c-type cytochrome [Terracidiphilus sp.]
MMRLPQTLVALALCGVLSLCTACSDAPGYPKPGSDVSRPDMELDAHALYKQNCAGCHGDNGRGGAAIPLNNPAYLAVAGADNLRTTITRGIPGTLMPAFAASSGGMLTDKQVNALVQGIVSAWARPADFSGVPLPSYSANTQGNATAGHAAYAVACARCHGTDGAGTKPAANTNAQQGSTSHSIVDPSYLALVNDQNLRSIVIAGHLDWNAPDWRSYIPGRALSPQQITDIVAWLATHRTSATETSMGVKRNRPPDSAKEKP